MTDGWVKHVRYPYAAGVILVMWVGTALLLLGGVPFPELVIALLAAATIPVAVLGFRR